MFFSRRGDASVVNLKMLLTGTWYMGHYIEKQPQAALAITSHLNNSRRLFWSGHIYNNTKKRPLYKKLLAGCPFEVVELISAMSFQNRRCPNLLFFRRWKHFLNVQAICTQKTPNSHKICRIGDTRFLPKLQAL